MHNKRNVLQVNKFKSEFSNVFNVSGSPVHSGYNYNGGNLNGSYRVSTNTSLSSPYKSLTTSPPSAKYSAPTRGQNFDPRTFTRTSAVKAGAYSLPPADEETKPRKSSYHRLNFGAKPEEENFLNTTYDRDNAGNNTYTTSDQLNSTFNKTSDRLMDNHTNGLNSTYDRIDATKDGLNSTFTRNGVNNATFDRVTAQSEAGLNTTFEKDAPPGSNGTNHHRKMSEDRLSSASSRYGVLLNAKRIKNGLLVKTNGLNYATYKLCAACCAGHQP